MRRPVLVSSLAAAIAAPAGAQLGSWTVQVGTSSDEWAQAVAADGAGGVFAGGSTSGSLAAANLGLHDAWLARYDANGAQVWIEQWGSAADNLVQDLLPDGAGGVFVTGTVGYVNSTAWLERRDGAGTVAWKVFVSTPGLSRNPEALAPAAGGAVVVAGAQNSNPPIVGAADAFLARYDAAGTQMWLVADGTAAYETALAACSDGLDGVLVAGTTSGSFGSPNAGDVDAWIASYDSAGVRSWVVQLGTAGTDDARGLCPDGTGGAIVAGSTTGVLAPGGGGGRDPWIARVTAGGVVAWVRQLGTAGHDAFHDVAEDGSGGAYLAGHADGSLEDALIARVAGDGTLLSSQSFGTGSNDSAAAIAADSTGVFAAGSTHGSLASTSAGATDAWFGRIDVGLEWWRYCTAGTSSAQCSATMSASGTPSASAVSGFTLTASHVDGNRSGLLFYGIDNSSWSAVPWAAGSSSFLCVKPPSQRTSLQATGGTAGSCNGTLSIDWCAFVTTHAGALGSPFLSGDRAYAQAWFRDPPAPKGTQLSDALAFVLQP